MVEKKIGKVIVETMKTGRNTDDLKVADDQFNEKDWAGFYKDDKTGIITSFIIIPPWVKIFGDKLYEENDIPITIWLFYHFKKEEKVDKEVIKRAMDFIYTKFNNQMNKALEKIG